MKYLFAVFFLVMIVASVFTYSIQPNKQAEVPVIYWVTDSNPARLEQVNKFHEWLIKHGFTKVGDPTKAGCEMRLDTASGHIQKLLIQGVSGVAGDVMDLYSAYGYIGYLNDVGMLEDITEDASLMSDGNGRAIHFDTSKTWAAIESNIAIPDVNGNSRQYAFPCNVFSINLFVNNKTLRKYGFEKLPRKWMIEDFERIGKAFVDKANVGKKYRDVFFAAPIETEVFYRTYGASLYNETLTACGLHRPGFAKALELKKRWMYDLRIIPSSADMQSFATGSGYGGVNFQLFNEGHLAVMHSGRYALIQLRKFKDMDLSVVEMPYGEFPNTLTGTRAAAVYKAGKNKKWAKLFLAFLASDDYNMQIVDDADALPPNPELAKTEAFLKPVAFKNEWGVHKVFSETMNDTAIPAVFSPYVIHSVARRARSKAESEYLAHRVSLRQAVDNVVKAINDEIQIRLKEVPALAERYKQACEKQKKIDEMLRPWKEIDQLQKQGKAVPQELKSRAQKIPLEMIDNIFYQRYYKFKGWAE